MKFKETTSSLPFNNRDRIYICSSLWLSDSVDEKGAQKVRLQTRYTNCIHYDNMSIIKLAKNLVMHGRSKYINIRFHFLRKLYKEGVIHKTKLLTL